MLEADNRTSAWRTTIASPWAWRLESKGVMFRDRRAKKTTPTKLGGEFANL